MKNKYNTFLFKLNLTQNKKVPGSNKSFSDYIKSKKLDKNTQNKVIIYRNKLKEENEVS